jgi:hypothetical protein
MCWQVTQQPLRSQSVSDHHVSAEQRLAPCHRDQVSIPWTATDQGHPDLPGSLSDLEASIVQPGDDVIAQRCTPSRITLPHRAGHDRHRDGGMSASCWSYRRRGICVVATHAKDSVLLCDLDNRRIDLGGVGGGNDVPRTFEIRRIKTTFRPGDLTVEGKTLHGRGGGWRDDLNVGTCRQECGDSSLGHPPCTHDDYPSIRQT